MTRLFSRRGLKFLSCLWITAGSSTETQGEVRDRDVLLASGRFGFEIAGPEKGSK